MRIFILGGTKDSTNIITHIKENYDAHILTTTTTEYGARLAREAGSDDTIARPLLKDEIIKIFTEGSFDILIDATHPFAEHITQTSVSIARELEIPYIRFERPTTNLESIDTSHIIYVDSFDEAGKLIESEFPQGSVLHFAGANTMADVVKYVSVDRFYPRILKVESSLVKCSQLDIDPEHIIPMTGAASLEENIDLIERYGASVMITKESGEIGGVIEKIEAANETDISVIMIQRPKIEMLDENDIVSDMKELNKKIDCFLKK